MIREQGGAEQNEHQRTRDRLEQQLTSLREDKESVFLLDKSIFMKIFKNKIIKIDKIKFFNEINPKKGQSQR